MTDLPDVAFKILSRADWRATLAERASSPMALAPGAARGGGRPWPRAAMTARPWT